jgi:DNA adenine methylase
MPKDEEISMIQPIVKWAGGKRQLLPLIGLDLPRSYSSYCEPFAGGAALLFHLQPQKAIINDLNADLINLYRVIKSDVAMLIKHLSLHENDKSYFYKIRAIDRDEAMYGQWSDAQRAARLLYLNRTCFNGLYRVNKKGQFNTPYGRYKNPGILNERVLYDVHHYFNDNHIEFYNLDFMDFFNNIVLEPGSFVYLDPPYDPFEEQGNFVQYQAEGFGKERQLQLKQICDTLTQREIKFMLSNSATPYIMDLYQNYHIELVKAKRIIASQVANRLAIDEVLVRNYIR